MPDAGAAAAAAAQKEAGNAAYAAKKFAKAVECYSRAIELDPSQHVFYSNRSGVLLDLGRNEEALRDARVCVEKAPGWAKGYFRLGSALEAVGQLPQALEAFDSGLREEEGNADLARARERLAKRIEAAAAVEAREGERKRPSFEECVRTVAAYVDPAVVGAPGVGPSLTTLVGAFPRVRLEGAPGEGHGRRLVAVRDIPAHTEVFTEVAAWWCGPFGDRFGAAIPCVAEQPPPGVGPIKARAAAAGADGGASPLDALMLQLEPFASARVAEEAAAAAAAAEEGGGGGAAPRVALPPLTRAELYMRVARANAIGAVFNENAPVRAPAPWIVECSGCCAEATVSETALHAAALVPSCPTGVITTR
jgi:hypothetical protein